MKFHKIFPILGILAVSCTAPSSKLSITSDDIDITSVKLVPEYDWGSNKDETVFLEKNDEGIWAYETRIDDYKTFRVYINNKIRTGLFMGKGAELVLNVAKDEDGKIECLFSGKGEKESSSYTYLEELYNDSSIYAFYESETINADSLKADIELRHQKYQESLASLKGSRYKPFFTGLSEAQHKDMVIRLYEMRADRGFIDLKTDEEYRQIMETVDPNCSFSARSTILNSWASYNMKEDFPRRGEDSYNYCMSYLDLADSLVTNRECRKAMISSCAYIFFMSHPKDNYKDVWARLQEESAEFPEVLGHYSALVESWEKTAKGNPAYDITLIDPAGAESALSSHFGKILYIDVWATWCVPCRAEIPYFEKVAEHFRGCDDVELISISMDGDSGKGKWLKKIEADKPFWPQFILNDACHLQFSKDWGIQGIPRFIIIDKEGRIWDADAMRPSDEGIIPLLESIR